MEEEVPSILYTRNCFMELEDPKNFLFLMISADLI